MTVCVVAMGVFFKDANDLGQIIIGASDRMLTAGDIQFEPQQTKVVPLTTSIALMLAGDSALQTEIILDVQAEINAAVARDPDDWWKVSAVADLYVKHYNRAKLRRAESAILAPLGLDGASFIERQRQMAPKIAESLTRELLTFQIADVATIITGIDASGGHIYVVENGDLSCRDNIGFAAIGAGYWHANSHLMFTGYTRHKFMPETMLAAYSAKKRAEVAPGVGEATDMFLIGPLMGSYNTISEAVQLRLGGIFQAEEDAVATAHENALTGVTEYVVEVIRETMAKAAESAGAPEQATDQKDPLGGEPKEPEPGD